MGRLSPEKLPLSPENGTVRLTRRRLLRGGIGGGTALLAGGGVAYGALFSPFHPVTERVEISLTGLPPAFDGLRIAQLTDLHVQTGFPADALIPALESVARETPDLIVLTGDYINDRSENNAFHSETCIALLSQLRAPLGVWAVFGNHDYPPPPMDPSSLLWTKAGIRTLSDEVAPLRRHGAEITLVGLRSTIQRPVNPARVLRLAPANAFTIVLWHEPDRAGETAAAGGSLQLSGHTHGGQVVIPGWGPPVLPIGGRLYPAGLYRVGGQMPLYVSRGVGLLPPRVRLNCPPEVTLLTLRRRA